MCKNEPMQSMVNMSSANVGDESSLDTPASRPLLLCPQPRESAQVALVLFGHAGGSAGLFDGWSADLPESIELWCIQLPGRGSRAAAPAFTDMTELCDEVIAALTKSGLLSGPMAFFGHSFGSLVAHHTARMMQQRKLTLPMCLLLSAHGPPTLGIAENQLGLPDRADHELMDALRIWGFESKAMRNVSSEVLSRLLAPVRADLSMREAHIRATSEAATPMDPLPIAVTVFGGDRDRSVDPLTLGKWRDLFCHPAGAANAAAAPTAADFACSVLPGGHFYAWEQEGAEDTEEVLLSRAALLRAVADRVAGCLAARPPSVASGPAIAPPERYVHEMVLAWAEASPDALAVIHDAGELTYRQLADDVLLLAKWLVSHGAGPGTAVAALLEHRYEYVLGQLAANLAGAAYFAMETHFGPNMLADLLEQTAPVAILSSAKLASRLEAQKLPLLNFDREWRAVAADAQGVATVETWPRAKPYDTGIITMTSGTTGKPKTILCPMASYAYATVSRAALFPYGRAAPTEASVDEREREASNVMFVWEAARPLAFGQVLVVISDETIVDTARLATELCAHRVTRILTTPSLMATFIETLPSVALPPDGLARLTLWTLCGEVVPARLAVSAMQALGHVRVVNDYSSWEGSDTAYAEVEPDPTLRAKYVPVGLPPPSVHLAILDPVSLAPVPHGVAGELYVHSPMLFTAYNHAAELTADRLRVVPAMLQQLWGIHAEGNARVAALLHAEGARDAAVRAGGDARAVTNAAGALQPLMYKTGDGARLLPSGIVQVTGRIDSTVKIRGFKIGLGYVEATIAALDDVARAVVVPLIDEATGQPESLVAHVVPAPAGVAAAEADEEGWLRSLREACRKELPPHALPRFWMLTRVLALGAGESKKIDRSKLPKPNTKPSTKPTPASTGKPSAPAAHGGSGSRAALEAAMLPIWAEVLGTQHVDANDNFFDIGGHSLLASKLVAAISTALGMKCTVLDLFDAPSVKQLAAALMPETVAAVPVAMPFLGAVESRELAIIGMAGRFPGANDVDSFWKMLCDGRDALTLWSRAELAAKGVRPEVYNHPRYVPASYIVRGAESFDAAFWGLSPHESAIMDPQQRLFMEVAWATFEHAGYAPRSGTPKRTAVVAAPGIDGYMHHHLRSAPLLDSLSPGDIFLGEVGSEKDYIATRVSFALDLMGPSLAVNSACSSALAAITQAAQFLLTGQADLALGGASALSFPNQGYLYEDGLVFSRDGRVRPFDADASGTVFGDAVGAVLLKRASDAAKDGDRVWATVRGFGVTNDGARRAGYAAPGISGQREAISTALAMAGVAASSISYVECHATATLVGDGIELRALTEAFSANGCGDVPGNCAIGSVKGNIGHANAAAGVTGLIKAVCCLSNATLVPTAHFNKLNPKVDLSAGPFAVNEIMTPWTQSRPSGYAGARRAGVSSFGIGGTDVHMILEQAPATDAAAVADPVVAGRRVHVLCVSAKSRAAACRAAGRLAATMRAPNAPSLATAAHALHAGRESFGFRFAVCASSAAQAAEKLDALAGSLALPLPAAKPPLPLFVFPGQGSQCPRMGEGLYRSEPRFRAHVDRMCAVLEPLLGFDLRRRLYPTAEEEASKDFRTAFDGPIVAQPAIFVTELALGLTLLDVGVKPAALAGHSIGEFVAATLAGVFVEHEVLALIAARAKLSAAAPEGAMLAASVSAERADEVAAEHAGELWVAVDNAPMRQVLAGTPAAVAAAKAELEASGARCRMLPLPRAYHTPLMAEAQRALGVRLRGMSLSAPTIKLCSNGTGSWMDEATATSADYWAAHVASTVHWTANMRAMGELPSGTVAIEVGSGSAIAPLLGESDAVATAALRTQPTLRHPRVPWADGAADAEVFCEALAELWTAGILVDWDAYYAGQRYVRVPLPTYAFEPAVHWTNPSASMYVPSTEAEIASAQQQLGEAVVASVGNHVPVGQEGSEPMLVRLKPAVAESRWATAYCLAYAGGSTVAFNDFAKHAPEWLEVVAVEMPGKGALADFAWPADAPAGEVASAEAEAAEAKMISRLAERLAEDAAGTSMLLVGWSMGGMLATEIALHLHAAKTPPRLLHIAGRLAPGSFVEAAAGDIEKYVLASPEVRQSEAWREWLLPMMMADLRADARAERRVAHALALAGAHGPPLSCQVQVCCGHEDVAFPPEDAPAWAAFCRGEFKTHVLRGGHDIMQKQTGELLSLVLEALTPPSPLYAVRWQPLEPAASAQTATLHVPVCLSLGLAAPVLSDAQRAALKSPAGLMVHLKPQQALSEQQAQCAALLELVSACEAVGGGAIVLLCSADARSALCAGASKAVPLELPSLSVQRLFLPDEMNLLASNSPFAIVPAVVDGWLRWLAGVATSNPTETDMHLSDASQMPLVPRLLPQPALPALVDMPSAVDPTRTYLISGGSGGIGGALVQWLISDQKVPPQQLVLLSRRGGTAANGVRSLRADVSDAESLNACAGLAELPPLGGIFHLAGVLDDGLIMNMDAARVAKVVAPKAGLFPLLARCDALGITPPWLVVASSTSSLLGYAGQANYCAANALFDQSAAFGLASTSPKPALLVLNFGPWGEVGMASEGTKAYEMSVANGEIPMPSSAALGCVAKALAELRSAAAVQPDARLQFMVADVEWWKSPWPRSSLTSAFAPRMPALALLPQEDSGSSSSSSSGPVGFDGGKGAATLSPASRRAQEAIGRGHVEKWMRSRLSTWEESTPLSELGLDSLDLVQLRNAFNKNFRSEGRLADEVPLSVFSNANQTLAQLMDKVSVLLA